MPRDSINLLEGYLQSQEYPAPRPAPPPVQPFVTLSREAGAGGTTIGTRLVARLREVDQEAVSPWLWLDRELIDRVIDNHHLPEQLSVIMRESRYNRYLKWLDEWTGRFPSWPTLVRRTNETILQLAQLGNVILVGRGAHLLTRRWPAGLHVRIIGSAKRRIEHIAEHHGISQADAEKRLNREDGGRRMYLRDYFDADPDDPHQYDLTINTDHVTYDDAVTLIGEQVLRIRAALRAPGEWAAAANRANEQTVEG